MRPKLYHSPMSPFVRKTMVAAIETGQLDDIDVVTGDPHGLDVDLRRANAISKIPALTTDDGVDLPESDLICLYLDERAGGGVLVPPSGPERWRVLRRQALADGFMEAAVHCRAEAARPEGARLTDNPKFANRGYVSTANFDKVEKLEAFAKDQGRSLLELAFGWLASQKVTASVIAGATKPEQIASNVAAAGWAMSDADLQAIDAIVAD